MLRDTGLAPELLGLEITESVLVDDADETVVLLDELKALGVRIALDDFGTGYSSLTYLQQLPIDELKIDRSFVAVLEDEASDLVLLQMMVQLGRAFDLKVVAEGIDTDRKLRRIQRLGCHFGQGYLFARPAPFDQVMQRFEETAEVLVGRRVPASAARARSLGRSRPGGSPTRVGCRGHRARSCSVRIVLLGAPGSGKGTQGERLAERLGVPHVASGELLRAHVAAESELGVEVAESLARGDLVPDDVVLAVVGEAVAPAAESGGYILDGFPRTRAQAERAHELALAACDRRRRRGLPLARRRRRRGNASPVAPVAGASTTPTPR